MAPANSDADTILSESRLLFLRIISVLAMIVAFCWPIVMVLFHLGKPTVLFNSMAFITALGLYLIATYSPVKAIAYWLMTGLTFFGLLFISFSPNNGSTISDYSYISIFPIIAMFLLEKKYGIILTVLYTLAILIILNVSQQYQSFRVELSIILFAAIGVTTFITYFYQHATERAQDLIKIRHSELKLAILQLQEEVKLREEAQKKLRANLETNEKQRAELQRLNSLMVGREIAMTQLKQKVKKLETEHPTPL